MATFQKIVLCLLLIFSFVIGQPSNAQGLKYRGVVGIPEPPSDESIGEVTVNGNNLYLVGNGYVYLFRQEEDTYYGGQRIVLRRRTPVPNVAYSNLLISSPDEKFLFVISTWEPGFQRRVLRISLFDWSITEWYTDEEITAVSNVVNNTIKFISIRGNVETYNLDGTKLSSHSLGKPYAGYFTQTTSNMYLVNGRNIERYTLNCQFLSKSEYAEYNYQLQRQPFIDSVGDMYATVWDWGKSQCVKISNGVKVQVVDGGGLSWQYDRLMMLGNHLIYLSQGHNTVSAHLPVDGVYDMRRRVPINGAKKNSLGNRVTVTDNGDLLTVSYDVFERWDETGKYLGSLNVSRLTNSFVQEATKLWIDSRQTIWFTDRGNNDLGSRGGHVRYIDVANRPQTAFSIDGAFLIGSRQHDKVFRWSSGKLSTYSYTGQLIKSVDVPKIGSGVSDISVFNGKCILEFDTETNTVLVEYDEYLDITATYQLNEEIYSRSPFVARKSTGETIVVSGMNRRDIKTYSKAGVLTSTVMLNLLSNQKTYQLDVTTSGCVIVGVDGPDGGSTQIYFADPNPPKTSASITSGWYRSNQTVQLTSLDPRPSSGFKALHSVLDTDAEVIDAIPNRTINISGDGQHKLIYWAEDVDGNIETKNELSIGIDSVPPVVDSVVEGNKFILLANDDRSGIASVRYSVDGASDLEYSGEVSLPYGSYEVVFWATDKAGNKSTVGKILVGSTFRWKSVYSSPIYAGKTLKATLELSAPAGINGVTLDISSSDPSLGSLKTAKILPGKTATTIEIPVLGVESDRLVDLSASLGGKTARTSVMVLVPYPSFLSINPRDVMGGNNTTITIKLPSVAPVGGQKITLSSSDLRVLVPESVTVPSGQTTITLPIATLVSSTPFSATLNARAGEKGSDAVVNVLSLPSSTFKISPATLNPGEKAVGAITLSAPAPASGVVFKLSSSSQDLTVPSTVTILPGNVRVLFDITAKSPITPITATVTATVDKTKLTSKVSIKPSAFKAVKLSSSSFSGEGSIVGTVELTGVAPSSGSLISLASNNANVSLPATVFVPAGSLIANFTVDVKEVKTPGIATITARSGVVVKFASLTLAPITVKTLEAVPSVVTGGSASVLRIELSGKPGPGGITITLSSSNSSVASVPASAAVAQGTTIVEVPIATSTVQTATEVVLSARVGTITKQATITVNP